MVLQVTKKIAHRAWRTITQEYPKDLYRSLPRRMQAVTKPRIDMGNDDLFKIWTIGINALQS